MKKLLLIAAILAIGTTAFSAEVSAGFSKKGNTVTPNIATEKTFGYHNITRGFGEFGPLPGDVYLTFGADNVQNGNPGSVNVFRDKGDGWKAEAQTKIALRMIQPLEIIAEADKIYLEAVMGDKVEIGDIEFLVKGQADADIKFDFTGLGSNSIFDPALGRATLTQSGLAGSFGFISKPLGETFNAEITGQGIAPYERRYELDLYLDLDRNATVAVYAGIIKVTGEYR